MTNPDLEGAAALAAAVRSRGRHNSLYDICRAADLIDRLLSSRQDDKAEIERLEQEAQDAFERASDSEASADSWLAEHKLSEAKAADLASQLQALREAVEKDALRYRYLREHRSIHYPMTHEQPAEWAIQWEFQQHLPEEAWKTFDGLIDADISSLDEDDRAALHQEQTGRGK